MSPALIRRILTRLEAAEANEPNPHIQDDYRIAWITVLYASSGMTAPHVSATYRVLGLHPDKVFAAIKARRMAKLGAEYEKFFGGAIPAVSSSPRKPVRSVRFLPGKGRDDSAA